MRNEARPWWPGFADAGITIAQLTRAIAAALPLVMMQVIAVVSAVAAVAAQVAMVATIVLAVAAQLAAVMTRLAISPGRAISIQLASVAAAITMV